MGEIDLLTAVCLGVMLGEIIVIAAVLGYLIFRRDPVDNSCEHNWDLLDRLAVQDPGKPVVAIIYIHRCTKCGKVTKDRIANKD